jgi:hypothetical protein
MKYRRFGSTDLQISEIVFGGGAQGGILFRGDTQVRREAGPYGRPLRDRNPPSPPKASSTPQP